MKALKSVLKQSLPTWIRVKLGRSILLPYDVSWYLGSKSWMGRQRLAALKNRHQGERCFIIGNGPSLRKTDLSRLREEVTFGLNRIYLLFDQMGFSTTYYVAVNRMVIEQCAQEIAKISAPKFISWWAHDVIGLTSDMMFVRDPYRGLGFSTDATRAVWEGHTVTYAAMQIAYYLGFQQVILIGVDHSYQAKGNPDTTVVSTGSDPNHFDPNYFGKGFRWQLPNLASSEEAYILAKIRYEQAGRQILDATVGGKLLVFPKVRFEEIFATPPRSPYPFSV
jgi:hypothetical protein